LAGLTRRRRLWLWAALAGLTTVVLLVKVTITGPRVHVSWQAGITAADRGALEQRHDLREGRLIEESTWEYRLGDWSSGAIAALLDDSSVVDTHYIDRSTQAVDPPTVDVGTRALPFPLSTDNRFESLWQFVHAQSICLFLAGAVLLRSARTASERLRRRLAIATLLAVGLAAYAIPIRPALLRMGDANSYTKSRSNFEATVGVAGVRFEAHLSHALLGLIYPAFGPDDEAPERTFRTLMRGATAWFIVCALGIGVIERWSARVVRYLALALLAPATVMYFGYRELGYLSLNVAAFPLLAHGLREGGRRLEAGSILAGLGAALHGFGLLSVVGAWIAALFRRASLAARLERALRIAAWSTAAYAGWLAVYVIVLKLPIATGHADSIPWRPLFVDEVGTRGNRVNVAILSGLGARDLLMTAWVVGAPLLAVAASLWKHHGDVVRAALWYAVPSVLFSVFFWPIQGLGVEMDLVVAAFPALYAAAWVCAQDERRTTIAAALLVSGHLAFWRIVLDTRFVNWTLT
jgi:hypothetical protein